FGDHWSDPLTKEELARAERYFLGIEKLQGALDFIRLRVGEREHTIDFPRTPGRRGLTFEAPRRSFMSAIDYQVFDDLLIGNFAKVTLHGDWGKRRLYPDFTPYVSKYADNGRARTRQDLRRYFAAYIRRDPLGYFGHLVELKCILPLEQSASRLIRGSFG